MIWTCRLWGGLGLVAVLVLLTVIGMLLPRGHGAVVAPSVATCRHIDALRPVSGVIRPSAPRLPSAAAVSR